MNSIARERSMNFLYFYEFISGVKQLVKYKYVVILKTFKVHVNYKFVIRLIHIQIWSRMATELLEINLELVGG